MNWRLAAFNMENLRHLLFRFAARARVGHGKAGGNAVGRKEQIAGSGLELAVEIKGKTVCAGDHWRERYGMKTGQAGEVEGGEKTANQDRS